MTYEKSLQKNHRAIGQTIESTLKKTHRDVSAVADTEYEKFAGENADVTRETFLSDPKVHARIRGIVSKASGERSAVASAIYRAALTAARCGLDNALVDSLVAAYGTGQRLADAALKLGRIFSLDRNLRQVGIIGKDKSVTEAQRFTLAALKAQENESVAMRDYLRWATDVADIPLSGSVKSDGKAGDILVRLKVHTLKARAWAKEEKGRKVSEYTPMRVEFLLNGPPKAVPAPEVPQVGTLADAA